MSLLHYWYWQSQHNYPSPDEEQDILYEQQKDREIEHIMRINESSIVKQNNNTPNESNI